MPFSLKTPFGYACALFIEITGETGTIYVVTSMLCYAIGTIWIIKSFINDITNTLKMLKMDKKSTAFENCLKLKRRFCDIIQNFSNAKQLSWHPQNICPIHHTQIEYIKHFGSQNDRWIQWNCRDGDHSCVFMDCTHHSMFAIIATIWISWVWTNYVIANDFKISTFLFISFNGWL